MFFDKKMEGYLTEVKGLFQELEASCKSIKLSLNEYQEIEQHVYADRIFNSNQRNLFKKLHRYYQLIEDAPKLDMQLRLSKKGKIKSIRLKLQNNAATLNSINFQNDPLRSDIDVPQNDTILINKVIPNGGEGCFEYSENVLIDLKKHYDVDNSITFNIEKNGFQYEMAYLFPDCHSYPEISFYSYDDLFEKRNNLLRLLNLEEVENPFEDYTVHEDRCYEVVMPT